jgi:hypothetical protein
VGLQHRPSLPSELEVLVAVRTRLKRGSTTISLTDDLEDLGAFGSVVLSPTINLQGACLGSRQVRFMVKRGWQVHAAFRVSSKENRLRLNVGAFN